MLRASYMLTFLLDTITGQGKYRLATGIRTFIERQIYYYDAKAVCREQPGNAKAMYRKAMAHSQLGDYEEAEQKFAQAKEADPSTAGEVDREVSKMRQREKSGRAKEKRDLISFFDRGKAS